MSAPLPGLLKEFLALLDQWPWWARMKAAPSRLDVLGERVKKLESLFERAPLDWCPYCGERTLKHRKEADEEFVTTEGVEAIRQTWICDACGKSSRREFDFS